MFCLIEFCFIFTSYDLIFMVQIEIFASNVVHPPLMCGKIQTRSFSPKQSESCRCRPFTVTIPIKFSSRPTLFINSDIVIGLGIDISNFFIFPSINCPNTSTSIFKPFLQWIKHRSQLLTCDIKHCLMRRKRFCSHIVRNFMVFLRQTCTSIEFKLHF